MERMQPTKNKKKDMPINPMEREDLEREDGDTFDNNSDVKRTGGKDVETMSDAEMEQGLKSTGGGQANPAQDEENH